MNPTTADEIRRAAAAEGDTRPRLNLIVTIPAHNEEENIGDVIREIPREMPGVASVRVLVLDDGSTDATVTTAWAAGADYVISHNRRLGLARTFKDAIDAALSRGADVIVNTDADNHYDQSRIPDLIAPIVAGRADIVVGSRGVRQVKMKASHRYGNLAGSTMVRKLVGLPDDIDVSSGFRAYDREAAMRMNVIAGYTYTHETLIAAMEQGMTIVDVPIPAREVQRPSRLMGGVFGHIARALAVIMRSYAVYQPIRTFSVLGILFVLLGSYPLLRFVYFYWQGDGEGHIQSLIIGGVMTTVGAQVFVLSLVASALSWTRRMIEELLYRERRRDYAEAMREAAKDE
ncbi:MAG: glycosyltransferase family 2 protein [Chloroflexi bacterium]|nr:glycosyltransferase family 2 protein [Chloroflexota bacterium]